MCMFNMVKQDLSNSGKQDKSGDHYQVVGHLQCIVKYTSTCQLYPKHCERILMPCLENQTLQTRRLTRDRTLCRSSKQCKRVAH
jgi:hypothetical protein